jgi:hypothetical protein
VVDMSGVRSFVCKVHGLLSRYPTAFGTAGVFHQLSQEDFEGWRVATRCAILGRAFLTSDYSALHRGR